MMAGKYAFDFHIPLDVCNIIGALIRGVKHFGKYGSTTEKLATLKLMRIFALQ